MAVIFMSFKNCRVTGPAAEILFDPAWGDYDMAVGERITSVYAGSADRLRFNVYPAKSGSKTGPASGARSYTAGEKYELGLYQQVRHFREELLSTGLDAMVKDALRSSPDAWLLHLELLELVTADKSFDGKLKARLEQNLDRISKSLPEVARFIRRGIT